MTETSSLNKLFPSTVSNIVINFRKNRRNPLLSERDYSKMAPPLDFGAKAYLDSDSVSNPGYEGIMPGKLPGKSVLNDEGDAGTSSNISEVSTPWGTARYVIIKHGWV